MNCEYCDRSMMVGLTDWHFVCPVCGLEASTLEPAELSDSDKVVDEVDREAGLESLRKQGFESTFAVLGNYRSGGRLLDVGCAHGWFLDEGKAAGFHCLGIEPSIRVAARGAARGHRILTGYFPAALGSEREFDVVSFNDVFEHIPGAAEVMRSTSAFLTNGGVLSIAIPSSRGVFYRLSKVLVRCGIRGPFERMWQKHFSSPHLYYFHADVLSALARREGLEPIYRGRLPSVRVSGLWARLNYDTRSSRAKNAIVFGAVVLAIPFLRLLPSDIDLLMYRKVSARAGKASRTDRDAT